MYVHVAEFSSAFDEFTVTVHISYFPRIFVFTETPPEMTIETVPLLTLPPLADPSKFSNFGRQVIGVDPGNLSPSEFVEIQHLLYKVLKKL